MCIELENGIAYYWMCYDTAGQIAAFTSASMARIPTAFSTQLDWYEKEVRPIANAISENLGERCDFKCSQFPQPMDSIRHADNLMQWDATRGLFIYDFAPHLHDAEYYLVYRPTAPLNLRDLPTSQGSKLPKFQAGFKFSDKVSVSVEQVTSMFGHTG